MSTPNQALAFIKDIAANKELSRTYNTMPEVFVDQVRQGYEKHYLDAAMVSDAAYSGKGTSTQDYFRIELRDCLITNEQISFKLKFSGRMNYKTGKMTALRAGGQQQPNEDWLKGFISNRVAITPEDVEAGLITQEDFNLLSEYAAWWVAVVEEKGENAPYKLYAKNRLWLVASNDAYKFQFQFELRNNPAPGVNDIPVVLGITDIEWANAHFSNTTPGVGVARIGIASGVNKGAKQAVPQHTRSFTPKVQLEPEEAEVNTVPSANRSGLDGL